MYYRETNLGYSLHRDLSSVEHYPPFKQLGLVQMDGGGGVWWERSTNAGYDRLTTH